MMPTERDFIQCHMCGMKNEPDRCKDFLANGKYQKIESEKLGTGCCRKVEE